MALEDKEFFQWLSHKITEVAWNRAKNEEEYVKENIIYPDGTILISKDRALVNLPAIKIGNGENHWNELQYI